MSHTADQQRRAAREHYNASLGDCPARQLLEAISGKWVTLVMLALAEGRQRHSDLRRKIPGVSQKMLTSTLRSLERDGLVSRELTAQVPVRTDYELTARGHSLLRIVFELKDWAEENKEDVASSRLEHDIGLPAVN
ncbi:helix-turn-helix transcriptional regulator [Paeniglutamicibacter sp. ABSL32-1]|uniref:winged helix-turn-helix transcriptional regulator n=1 Tax=Paeniglutamicibacter quisquiliarum TaxID=2849498 RepID=UPI001C2D14AB|nr:helix-turn-helix domain-containing protein [Paeniglutamicibacter quisquiliarum]MBV1781323.1 helix-turn-helix transcriptional regulator [Paeniglutamicibacter quisquiliarum]